MKYTTLPLTALKEENIIPSRCGDEFAKEDDVIIILMLDATCVMGINIWYDSDEKPSVNYVTRSGRVYQPTEKDMIKGK